MSAESGLKTFRDHEGLWEKYDVARLATAEAVRTNLHEVNQFYNFRRKQLYDVEPNAAHIALAELGEHHDVTIITQNVDDLHERGGSQKVIHIHGELRKVRHVETGDISYREGDIDEEEGLRPHICLFGEMPFFLHETMEALYECDLFVCIGTSGNVHPAAGYIDKINQVVRIPTIEINVEDTLISHKFRRLMRDPATESVVQLVEELINEK